MINEDLKVKRFLNQVENHKKGKPSMVFMSFAEVVSSFFERYDLDFDTFVTETIILDTVYTPQYVDMLLRYFNREIIGSAITPDLAKKSVKKRVKPKKGSSKNR